MDSTTTKSVTDSDFFDDTQQPQISSLQFEKSECPVIFDQSEIRIDSSDETSEISDNDEKVSDCEFPFEIFLHQRLYSEEEVVSNICNGVLLKGISDLNSLTLSNHSLIKIKRNLRFSFSWKLPLQYKIGFRRRHERFQIEKKLKNFGVAAAIASQRDFKMNSCTENEMRSNYQLVLVLNSIASWQPRPEDFSLSIHACKRLKEIDFLLTEGNMDFANLKCEDFIVDFGSHVIMGQVHFGKIEVHEKMFCKSPRFPRVRSLGGDNSTKWVITDREVIRQDCFIGIWKIILEEPSIFENAKALAELIREKSLKKTVGIEIREKYFLHDLLHKMHDWLLRCSNRDENIAGLKHVVHEISRVKNESLWIDIYKSCRVFPSLVSLISKGISDGEREIEIKRYLNIFQTLCAKTVFPNKEKFESLVDNCSPFESEEFPAVFVKDLNHLFELIDKKDFSNMTENRPNKGISFSRFISTVFTRTIDKLLIKLRSKEWHADYLFLISILLPFGYKLPESVFETSMIQDTLIKFSSQSKEPLKTLQTFEKHSMVKQHAWVVQMLLNTLNENKTSELSGTSYLLNEFKTSLRLHRDVLTIVNNEKTLKEKLTLLSKKIREEEEKLLAWSYLETTLEKSIEDLYIKQSKEQTNEPKFLSDSDLKHAIHVFVISHFFPGKMSIQNVRQIQGTNFLETITIQDIPWVMLHLILSCNIQFLEISYSGQKPTWLEILNDNHIPALEKEAEMEKQEQIFEENKDKSEQQEDEEEYHDEEIQVDDNDLTIHPLDMFHAVFLCCDPFLRGLLFRKLMLLKKALPFIHNDFSRTLQCSLMSLDKIFIDESADTVATKCMKTVSFVKLGEFELSKSEIINGLLGEQCSSQFTFFHRNCKFGDLEQRLYRGTIEIAWNIYKKSETTKHSEILLETVTLFNLRGDGLAYLKQLDILSKMTNILVIFVESRTLESDDVTNLVTNLQQQVPNTIIVTNKCEIATKRNRTMLKNTSVEPKIIFSRDARGRTKNAINLKECILRSINGMLSKTTDKDKIHLEKVIKELVNEKKLRIDGFVETCSTESIETFFSNIQDFLKNMTNKDNILPLQSRNLMHKWSSINRELHSGPSQSLSLDVDLEETLSQIRIKQAKKCTSEMTLFADFISILISCGSNIPYLTLFISKIENMLERNSRAIIPQLSSELVETYRSKSLNTEEKERIRKMHDELEDANFSILHFFREMGQTFECFYHCKFTNEFVIEKTTWGVVQILPRIIAQLLLSGHSFEIMNGEAVDISLNWIEAVFKELTSIKGEKKIFSVSVLGIQSSGKSTLLNTMFGLEAPVSSGRCTRGINLYMIPVKNPNVEYEYAFIFDTEGLRSSSEEANRTSHDNKLATLAIGIADIVLFNLKGENVLDMENIFQIVVHALIRLKQANSKIELRQSCVLVHQNVYLTDKGYNLKPDIERTYSKLNEITRNIADQEQMDISSFNDVISFNTEKDVMYVPNLWLGEPPMAPVSAAYSVEVGKIAKHVLEECSLKVTPFYNIMETFHRIKSMWEGILKEDFVFSFQNIIQMKAYNHLQEATNRLKWQIELHSKTFWREHVRPKLFNASLENIENIETRLQSEFSISLRELTEFKIDFIKEFIKSAELKSEMIQWQESKILSIKETSSQIKVRFNNKLRRQAMHLKIKYKHLDKGTEEKLLKKITENARCYKKMKIPEEKREEKFNEAWQLLLSEIVSELPHDAKNDNVSVLREGIRVILYDEYEEYTGFLKTEWANVFHDSTTEITELITENEITEEHINIKFRGHFQHKIYRSNIMDKWKKKTFHLAKQILKDIEQYFTEEEEKEENLECDDKDFKNYVLPKVIEPICTHNKNHKHFSLKPEFQIKLAVKAAKLSCLRFSKLNQKVEESYNIYTFVLQRRALIKDAFLNILDSEDESVTLSNYLCNEIKPQIEKRVSEYLSESLTELMLERFSFLKCNLINDILKDLAAKEEFEIFLSYIKSPEEYAKQWIKEQGITLCNEKDDHGSTFYKRHCLNSITQELLSITETAALVNKRNQKCSINKWIEKFREKLDFLIDNGYTSLISEDMEIDVSSFYATLQKHMFNMGEVLKGKYSNETDLSDVLDTKKPFHDIFSMLWGCTEHCPFCFEPCENTTKDHVAKDHTSHTCVQHRPFGLNGFFYIHDKTLAVETCNFMVQNNNPVRCGEWCECIQENCSVRHPMSEYKKWVPEWTIPPKDDISASKFWCWFTAKYIANLTEKYKTNRPIVPQSWIKITKIMALKSLDTPEKNPPYPEKSSISFIQKVLSFFF